METIVPTIQETNLRYSGFLVLSQDDVDTLFGGDPNISEFDGGTIYRRGDEAVVTSEPAQDPELVIWGNRCNIRENYVGTPIYVYEVSAIWEVEWGPLEGVTEGPLRVLGWYRYASVPAALMFYSFVVLDKRD